MDYIGNYYFEVLIIGIPTGPVLGSSGKFSRVSGLGANFVYETFNEGGSNYQRAFFKEVAQQTLVLEQGTVTDFDHMSLAMNMINLGTEVTFEIIIMLKNEKGSTLREWTVIGAHLTKYEGPELNSNAAEVAVSRMEFIYSGAF